MSATRQASGVLLDGLDQGLPRLCQVGRCGHRRHCQIGGFDCQGKGDARRSVVSCRKKGTPGGDVRQGGKTQVSKTVRGDWTDLLDHLGATAYRR